jgi:cyclomaltodextrinase / maltogenic alpha-amylase / neopullulanase
MKAFLSILLLFLFSFSLPAQSFHPEWAEGIIWYQIFPERFSNGDSLNDPDGQKVFMHETRKPSKWEVSPWTINWFEKLPWEKELGGNVRDHMYRRRYGGDIQGIINNLDYLKQLGVGAVYINPLFESVSLHKYDATVYHHIDKEFGPNVNDLLIEKDFSNPEEWKWTAGDSLFLKLIEEIHSRGMKIVIDGVFNHAGIEFPAFKDIREKGKDSKYYDWFMIKSLDDPSTPENEFDYKGWWDNRSMPEFNRTENDLHPGPKQYIFHVTQRWMDPDGDGDPSDGIDGWRLDVARDVPLGFWKDWSRLVKHINKDAIIIGELWELSPDFISEQGAFDALMNYNFAYAVNNFFIADQKRIPVSEFIDMLKKIDETYPEKTLNLLQNLIDSHDTDRLSSMIVNPDRNFDRDANEENKNYNPGKPSPGHYELQKMIAAFQMTYRGSPMIYYGTEVGMWGADDPHTRKPMVWDYYDYDDELIDKSSGFSKGFGKYKVEQNKDLLSFYQKMTALRNTSNAVKRGDLNFLYSNDSTQSFAFERNFMKEKVIAAFNHGTETDEFSVKFNEGRFIFEEIIMGEKGQITTGSDNSLFKISLPPASVKVYKILKLN